MLFDYLKFLHFYLTLHIFKLRRTTLNIPAWKIQIKSEITQDAAWHKIRLSGVTARSLISSYLVWMAPKIPNTGHRQTLLHFVQNSSKTFRIINVQLINCLHNVDHVKSIFLDVMHHCIPTSFCIILMWTDADDALRCIRLSAL